MGDSLLDEEDTQDSDKKGEETGIKFYVANHCVHVCMYVRLSA